ncbi:GNAT family N-acetyltransferase [Aestuariivirga sp. YIM B02566]|uniref:GNAT family N-acetyltransferase n=1 Tax=Taklimakanibacter albus TaxID=2800327 RepID=UPI001FEF0A83|nr:GNAT family N-acetyltransferase [Aestuariivirga sp. YIM B02566]
MDQAARVLRLSFDAQYPWLSGLHTPDEDRYFFREILYPSCQIWGAIAQDLIGIIAFRPGMIEQLYVLPDCQGRGAGSALLAVAMSQSDELELWTFQRNARARRFYEAKGFVATKKTDGSENEEREPDVLYRWERRAGASGIDVKG